MARAIVGILLGILVALAAGAIVGRRRGSGRPA
jgi:hypothetical protein